MAATILRAQDQRRDLTQWETGTMTRMIHSSDNPAASALWVNLGGLRAMSNYGARLGLSATVETHPKWGLTSTSAEDQAAFIHRLLQGRLLGASGSGLASDADAALDVAKVLERGAANTARSNGLTSAVGPPMEMP